MSVSFYEGKKKYLSMQRQVGGSRPSSTGHVKPHYDDLSAFGSSTVCFILAAFSVAKLSEPSMM